MNTIVNGKSYSQEDDEIDFSNLVNQLVENRWLILIITFICLLCGILYASWQIPIYQSSALLQVQESQSPANSIFSNISSHFGGEGGNSTQVQIALIQSRFVLEPVGQLLGLDISVRPSQTLLGRFFSPVNAKAIIKSFIVSRNTINHPFRLRYEKKGVVSLYNERNELILRGKIGVLLSNANETIQLQVSQISAPIGTQFIIIKHSPAQVVSNLKQHLKIQSLGGPGNNIGLLEILFDDTDPNKAVRTLNVLVREAQIKDSEKKSLEASQTLKFLYAQLPITKNSLEEAELALNKYRAKSGKIDMKIQTQGLIQQLSELDKQLAKLHINQINMAQNYTSVHPMFQALTRKIKAIENDRADLEKNVKALPASDQIAVNLMRDVEVKSELYTVLLNKIQELEVIQAGVVSNVRILAYAKLPDGPLPTKKPLIYLESILLGFVLSAIIIFGRKMLYPKVIDPHWIEKQFNIANLAIVPYADEQPAKILSLSRTRENKFQLLAQVNPKNLSIESLRSLRTSLQVNLSCAKNNIISIMGLTPGVGKTFISVNLAYLLATADKKVLLIDADLRKGTINKYFNLAADPGFSELIQGVVSLEEAIKPSSHKNLFLLSRGNYPTDPSELLSGGRCNELLYDFSKKFDIVIIDTAPVLLVTDAALIGTIAGTNYLVLGSNVHRPSDIEMAMKRLNSSSVTVHGSIFNFHNASSQKNSYYGRYSAHHYYYDNSTEFRGKTLPFSKRKKKKTTTNTL